jgi:hypothetical protein
MKWYVQDPQQETYCKFENNRPGLKATAWGGVEYQHISNKFFYGMLVLLVLALHFNMDGNENALENWKNHQRILRKLM